MFEATIVNIIFGGAHDNSRFACDFSEAALGCFSSISVLVNNLFFLFSVFIFCTFFFKKIV